MAGAVSGENMMGERKWEGVGGGGGCTLSVSDFTALSVLAETRVTPAFGD